jgi:SOUL heme-binding protein
MLANFLYYLVTDAEAVLSFFGIRSFYEQTPYAVVERLGDAIEIRSYGPRLAVETTVEGSDSHTAENEAFRLLLSYIAGANRGSARFAMTAPVEQTSQPSLIAMTAPVEITGKQSNRVSMRFFLPGARCRGSTRAARQSSEDRGSCTIDTRGSAILRRSERRY